MTAVRHRALTMVQPGEPWVEVSREAAPLGSGEVRVEVRGVGVNYHDYANALGFIPGPLPRVPMTDGAGVITETGPGVEGWAVGDRVIGSFYPRWQAGPIDEDLVTEVPGDTGDGWLQEQRICRADELVPTPPHLDDVEAASLPCAGTTAWSALELAGIGPGSVVVAMGTGGVSLFVLQLAKARGARVIVLSSSDDKLAIAGRLGADEMVNYNTHPDWHLSVRELTGDVGADLVVDVAGEQTLPTSIRAVRYGGTVAVVGVVSGMGSAELPITHVMLRNIRVAGVTVGSVADHRAMAAAVADARIHPHLSHTFDWREAEDAIALVAAAGHVGKVGLVVPPSG
ncbi:zinc-dependent alcohol dehydrogenase family protein [Nocardioides sp. URHA0020]|uniref:zinc-dependent alcohol dehydrogenase family protein n=1 Tax=Nocardioides sp. URHA0020 TaxID=1380392 RepID=UPI000687B571|nr:NAD(P)-dependent alcohol dehydrogenase [Nocardioides sp. URHA0020]